MIKRNAIMKKAGDDTPHPIFAALIKIRGENFRRA